MYCLPTKAVTLLCGKYGIGIELGAVIAPELPMPPVVTSLMFATPLPALLKNFGQLAWCIKVVQRAR